MRKSLLAICVLFAAWDGFAQGRNLFANDSLHLVFFSPDQSWLLPGDSGLAGQAYDGSVLSDGGTLVADLYAGTSASSLSLVASDRDFASTGIPGEWQAQALFLLSLPGGATNYFQILVHDSRWSSLVGPLGQGYWGETPVFTAVSGPGIAPYRLAQNGAPAYSTWAPGDFPMDSPFPGGEGAIELRYGIPEPSLLALAAVGAVAVLRGRRKAAV